MSAFYLLLASLTPFPQPFFPSSHHFTDRRAINAPRNQYVLLGSPTSLNCSYPGAFTTWKRNNITISGSISSANISDEGWYTCDPLYQLTELVYRLLSFCMWLVSSLRIHETQWMSIAFQCLLEICIFTKQSTFLECCFIIHTSNQELQLFIW